jgi:hypothetical protein
VTNFISRLSRKKKLLFIVAPVLVLVGVGVFIQLSAFDQESATKRYESGCNAKTIDVLKTAYDKAPADSALKANRAEQIGNCSAITGDKKETAKWYRQAENDYRKVDDVPKVAATKLIADNYEALSKIEEPTQPDTVTEEQKKQGLGSE